jgi:hypothetical protein
VATEVGNSRVVAHLFTLTALWEIMFLAWYDNLNWLQWNKSTLENKYLELRRTGAYSVLIPFSLLVQIKTHSNRNPIPWVQMCLLRNNILLFQGFQLGITSSSVSLVSKYRTSTTKTFRDRSWILLYEYSLPVVNILYQNTRIKIFDSCRYCCEIPNNNTKLF